MKRIALCVCVLCVTAARGDWLRLNADKSVSFIGPDRGEPVPKNYVPCPDEYLYTPASYLTHDDGTLKTLRLKTGAALDAAKTAEESTRVYDARELTERVKALQVTATNAAPVPKGVPIGAAATGAGGVAAGAAAVYAALRRRAIA